MDLDECDLVHCFGCLEWFASAEWDCFNRCTVDRRSNDDEELYFDLRRGGRHYSGRGYRYGHGDTASSYGLADTFTIDCDVR